MIEEQLYINGVYRPARSGETKEAHNPATGEIIGSYALGGREDALEAVDAAERAFGDWRGRSARDRALILRDVAARIRDKKSALAELLTLENGKVVKESNAEIEGAALHFEWYAEEAQRINGRWVPPMNPAKRHLVIKQPVGIVLAIMPFNFPVMLWARKVAPAMAAGCTTIVRGATSTTLITCAAARILHEAGLPPGVMNLITGRSSDISETLLTNPKIAKLTFTGSTAVGVHLQEMTARSLIRTSMELGGNAPAVVLDDCDLDLAVDKVIGGKFRNLGQSCIAINRILVQKSIETEFLAKLAEKIAALKTGNGLDEGVDLGSLIDGGTVEKVERHVQDALDKGGKLLVGGNRLTAGDYAKGNFYEPTLISETRRDMMFMDDETFGPVAFVMTFDTEAEAIEKANDTEFGLAAYVFTRDYGRALRVSEAINAGTVALNDDVPSTTIAPFGGYKMSGLGRECGSEGIDAFLETKHISIGMI